MRDVSSLRVAIVHERFTELGGSERVVEQLHEVWPGAQVLAPIVERDVLPEGLRHADVRASPLQRLHKPGRSYAPLLPLLPGAMSRLDLSGFDLVVTSHHAFANRVRPPAGVPVVSYTHTPARWIWMPAMREDEIGGAVGRAVLGSFARTQRRADRAAAARVSAVVVNSGHVAARVAAYWGRDSTVVHPPVNTTFYEPGPDGRDDFFLLAGRLVPYKRPHVAVAAARRAGVRLVVAGDGRMAAALRELAGPGVELRGRVGDDELRDLFRRCRALVFPGEEDFGIVPVEAQACGAPVVARGVGGAVETVVPGRTGVLYPAGETDDEVERLAAALQGFDPADYDSAAIRSHAEEFSAERFRSRFVDALLAALPGLVA